jgi:hypothetical protein
MKTIDLYALTLSPIMRRVFHCYPHHIIICMYDAPDIVYRMNGFVYVCLLTPPILRSVFASNYNI